MDEREQAGFASRAAGFDARITPVRPDLAAHSLRGRVVAERYADGEVREIADPQAPVRREPRPDAALDTEALCGERVTMYDANGEGWCWGQLAGDGYVGWLPENALTAPGPAATHKVAALRTLMFPGPSIKAPPTGALPFGARVAIVRMQDNFAVTAAGGFLPAQHLVSVEVTESDFVAVAERFVGTPYLWGGKTALGIDCSGLVQVALTACGLTCPRDSDMQEEALGASLDWRGDITALRRGDLVFWKGHVAIVRDGAAIVHANAHHMAVAIEPTAGAIARIRAAGSDVTSVRRLALPAVHAAGGD
jgi:cell wall-associated NlpC family hydrolase